MHLDICSQTPGPIRILGTGSVEPLPSASAAWASSAATLTSATAPVGPFLKLTHYRHGRLYTTVYGCHSRPVAGTCWRSRPTTSAPSPRSKQRRERMGQQQRRTARHGGELATGIDHTGAQRRRLRRLTGRGRVLGGRRVRARDARKRPGRRTGENDGGELGKVGVKCTSKLTCATTATSIPGSNT
jgi:hypothetical protein